MTSVDAGRSVGMERVWRLTEEGYRIVDVDSDDLFVGVRLERDGRSVTLLLTRDDFAGLFPGMPLSDARREGASDPAPRDA